MTLKCLSELDQSLASSGISTEIIVCDNASVDGSPEALSKVSLQNAKYKYIQNDENVGFSKGNNQAFRESNGKYILFLNSDVMVGESNNKLNWRELLAKLESDENLGALTVRVDVPGME
ncbi:MAG: glycosyltransferase [Patescibacteria group bacterium]